MARQVKHKQIYRPGPFGTGTVNRTLCGFVSNADAAGMNVASSDSDVTCKFCLRLMAAEAKRAERRSARSYSAAPRHSIP